jgi:hypothetical protein
MHTTGPWIVLADSPAAIRDLHGSNVAPEICHLEDARLMAAAPDLLAALQSVVDRYAPTANPANDAVATMWRDARAAIARATSKD